ncbi:MAG TPA: S8 family peptidase, partial [Nocardioides sp.]|nr:S8 family peptidase [Nocardioides sp.]
GSVVLASVLALGGTAVAGPAPAEARTAGAAAPATAPAGLLDVVVTLQPGTDPAAAARSLVTRRGGQVTALFSSAVDGFAATLTDALLTLVRGDARVRSVELDTTFRTTTTQSPTPSWGLDRVDQRSLPLNRTYTYLHNGTGVDVYLVDTGLQIGHPDFGGRAVSGTDTVDRDSTAQDCNGHGTHVAGTAGGARYGVAKRVRLIGVRVLDCDGSGQTSQVVAGLDWVVRHHRAGRPAVVNMSLSGPVSAAMDTAVRNVIADGVTVVVAAGNDNVDACKTSPARVPGVLTVAASDRTDARATFSNWGTCVDLFAPGVDITSDWKGSATRTISGTSMATPHVVGAAAVYLDAHPSASPATVHSAIVGASTKGKITGAEKKCLLLFCSAGTPNNGLLYVPR